MPEALVHEADRLADVLGMSCSRLCAAAIAEYIERPAGAAITDRLNALYADQAPDLSAELSGGEASGLGDEAR